MKYHLYIIALFLLGGMLSGGCSSVKTSGVSVTTDSEKVVLDPSSQGTVKLTFHVPADYLSRRGRLLIMPRVVTTEGEVVQTFQPVAVDAPVFAKKMHRKEVLEGYVDSIPVQVYRTAKWDDQVEIPYETPVRIPENLENVYVDAVVSNEICTTCGTVDTLFVAGFQKTEPVDTFPLRWVKPVIRRLPKVQEGRGVAALQFVINRSDINSKLGNNLAELEKMENKLRPILEDSLATIQTLYIVGMASADGSLLFNTRLAYQRAEAAKQWLIDRMAIAPEVAERIMADVRPEGWESVLEAMQKADDKYADAVEAVLERYPSEKNDDDVQERVIRRLPCWNHIRDNYLQRDRKVEYLYTYTLKSFVTDEEVLGMYELRPDAFSEEEFLRVGELKPTLEEKIEVYRKLLVYYPDSEIGKNNLAVLEHEQEKQAKRKGDKQ